MLWMKLRLPGITDELDNNKVVKNTGVDSAVS